MPDEGSNPQHTTGPGGAAPAGRGSYHVPGEPGLWVLIMGDLVIFSAFFLTYTMAFVRERALFQASQQSLNVPIGLINTLILLTSSWAVARGVTSAREGRPDARSWLICGMLLGLSFIAMKFYEYSEKYKAGITLNTNEFFIFYFTFTGIHLVHVIIGLGILAFCLSRFKYKKWTGSILLAEVGGVYWHLVDILWLIIFALIYLM